MSTAIDLDATDAELVLHKNIATLKAKAALAGCSLHELSGGGFLLCRWGLSRELPDLRAVNALMEQIGARS
jgi:hypothetical protein